MDLCQVDGLEIDATLPNGRTSLHTAAETGNLTALDILFRHKANLNISDVSGRTPLILAVEFERLDAVKLLLKNGADCTAGIKENGWTPLHIAVHNGNIEIARMLNCELEDLKAEFFYPTPASLAIQGGNASMILLFIEREAGGLPRLEALSPLLSKSDPPSIARDQRMKCFLLVSKLLRAV